MPIVIKYNISINMITVIIPTYKPGAYLWKCLDSLESQTIAKNLYEVIVILNGCKEPYETNIAQGIGKYSMNIRIEQTDKAGVSNARNIGLDMANGDYICFIDDDDWVSDSYLQSLYIAALETGHIAVSNVEAIEDGSGTSRPDYLSVVYQSLSHKKTVSLLQARKLLSSSCCKMIPMEIIGNDRFKVGIARGEDSLFMAQISCRVKRIAIANSTAVYFRLLRFNSASRSSRQLKRTVNDFVTLEYYFFKVYLSHIFHYNPIFFWGRILAVFKGTIIEYFTKS